MAWLIATAVAGKVAVKLPLALLALGLAGCSGMLRSSAEEPQAIVDRHVIGLSAGDFFQRYGAPLGREEGLDGSLAFNWQSSRMSVVGGPYGPLISACRLRLSADRNGRIVAAPIVRDGDGKRRVSGCAELFEEG